MLRRNIYKWHRSLSLIIAVPVILWALSGFMHPVMTNIRPKVSTQFIPPVAVDSAKIKVPLQTALLQNHIAAISAFRLVQINHNWFYQVQTGVNSVPVYLATLTGKVLASGDWIYAQYIARQFLEGVPKESRQTGQDTMAMSEVGSHDCCDAATACVLHPAEGARVANATLITSFNNEYKSINRLLPVYKVSFDRPDGIRIYVETTTGRFAFAMDNERRVFDRIFTLVHTWGWLDFLGKGKLAIEFILVFLAFITTVMGIYLFFISRSKRVEGNPVVKARRNHRFTAISISLFTLMFTFSGAFHALSKFREDTRGNFFVENQYAASSIHFDFPALQKLVKKPVVNVGLITLDKQNYWRVNTKAVMDNQRKDLMKDAKVSPASAIYIHTDSLTILPDGEIAYAKYLAARFSGHPSAEITGAEAVVKFGSDYNFTDKRLPVWKVSYASGDHERYYVETSTGRLSKSINDKDLIEDYSFAFLHKHEFMSWGGKGVKDFSTMFWAMAQVAMVSIGLILYFKSRKRNRKIV